MIVIDEAQWAEPGALRVPALPPRRPDTRFGLLFVGGDGALLSFAPETIVVDIDAEGGIATVHDFVARSPGFLP